MKGKSKTEHDSKLVVTFEPDVAKVANEGVAAQEFRDNFFVLRRHVIHPTSGRTKVQPVAQFYTRAGLDSYLASKGIDAATVEFRLDKPKPAS